MADSGKRVRWGIAGVDLEKLNIFGSNYFVRGMPKPLRVPGTQEQELLIPRASRLKVDAEQRKLGVQEISFTRSSETCALLLNTLRHLFQQLHGVEGQAWEDA